MKRFLIEILITSIIVFITRKISDTYICGGIAGIISTYIYLVVDEILKRLEDTEFNEAFKKAKENNIDMKLRSCVNDFEEISEKYLEELKAFL